MSARAHNPATVADHYERLGVARTAALPELRRAFRLLALRHHPDRAGPQSTEVFQSLAEAYATLCDPVARARYDERLRAFDLHTTVPHRTSTHTSAMQTGEFDGLGGRIGWRRQRAADAAAAVLLARLSGSLEALVAAGIARRLADGLVELWLLADEVAEGGTAAIDAAVRVACPTCSGIAEAGVLWCRRCEFAGTVIDQVTFTVVVPRAVRDGVTFTFETDPSHRHPPLRIRLRHQSALSDNDSP